MDLIEQLNGYSECLRLRAVPAASGFRIRGIEFTRDELERAMLEYRRQHNIFEVRDSVVPKKEYRIGDRVGTVEKMLAGGVWVVFDSSSKMLTPIYTIEHATDEEIKAGKRL